MGIKRCIMGFVHVVNTNTHSFGNLVFKVFCDLRGSRCVGVK